MGAGRMTSESDRSADDSAETAFVGDAGEPHRGEESGPRADQAPPTDEELDAREEHFTRPRKPMGPVQSSTPETVPDEP
jgi:hypothetical protein